MVTTHFDFFKTVVFYEVNIRQYTPEGTFLSFSRHLERLRTMGVDVLWLMPVHPIGIINRKGTLGSYYAISNHHEVNSEFGTKADLKQLIAMAHSLGMKVILDWVANHVACDHVWTEDHPDFLIRNEDGSFFSPHGWEDVIQINHQNPMAHKAMINEMTYWVEEFDIDGFRAHLAHLTPLSFWIAARHHTHQLKSNLIWLAESEQEEYFQAFDILFAWNWMHITEAFCKGQHQLNLLSGYLNQQCMDRSKSFYKLYFTSNHDENSWNGTEFEKYGLYADLLTVLHFFLPFAVPLIYNGQELPNEKRLAFFDRDPIDWNKPLKKASLYQQLIDIRKSLHEFSCPEIETLENGLLILKRTFEKRMVRLFLNTSNMEVCFLNYKYPSSINHKIWIQHVQSSQEKEGYLLPGDFIMIEDEPIK